MALASTALATPALARDHSWYVGVEGGGMIVEDIKYDIAGANNNAGTVNSNYGYDVGGQVGYDLGMFRIEAEVAYKDATVDSYRSSLGTPIFTSTGGSATAPAGTYNYAGGRTTALSFMVNGLLDFGDDDSVQGFVGGGVGVARVKEKLGLNTYGRSLDDSDTVFAYQGIAGVRAPLTDHLDVSFKYRFFTAPGLKFTDVAGRRFDGRFRSHSLLGGITYNFGAPEAPPPPPPPPPPPVEAPPPPPPPAVCSPGPFIVFFEWDKSDITPEASSILDNAVTAYQSCGNAQVMLAGFTDTSGTTTYNQALGQRRADAVKAYLTAHGVPDGTVSTQSFGEDPSHLRVQTADGVREVQNRRVEITYGPGAGM